LISFGDVQRPENKALCEAIGIEVRVITPEEINEFDGLACPLRLDPDTDSDGTIDGTDVFPCDGGQIGDTDGDTIDDLFDNCTLIANSDQRDTDSDGYGSVCDPDFNQNNFVDPVDFSTLKTMFGGPPGPSALAPP
jgi:hypothetical protein